MKNKISRVVIEDFAVYNFYKNFQKMLDIIYICIYIIDINLEIYFVFLILMIEIYDQKGCAIYGY